jgi:N-acylneuraminate cytidylyltransferase/CMP-N,N'-diacetyllegionaminic acid synthase
MISNKKILGIVLARAGSKGLPGKNSRLLAGKPLVQYAIEAGMSSRYIDDVVISSDCDVCIQIAVSLGAKAPFKRPKHLAADTTLSSDVITHVIDYLQAEGNQYDMFVLLEPTSPLRDAEDIDRSLEAMITGEYSSLVSVCQAEDQHPCFMFEIQNSSKLVTWSGDKFVPLRRQDIEKAYYLDGSVYISDVDTFSRLGTFCHDNTGSYVVPKWKSHEVDDIWDFICIEAIMKYRQENTEALYD